MLMRYAMLVGAAAAAIWGAVNLGTSNASMMLVDAGQGAPQTNLSLWVLGLISLSGVVVRNAIILIEYIEERRAAGVPLEEAALEAGKRRLRPREALHPAAESPARSRTSLSGTRT